VGDCVEDAAAHQNSDSLWILAGDRCRSGLRFEEHARDLADFGVERRAGDVGGHDRRNVGPFVRFRSDRVPERVLAAECGGRELDVPSAPGG